MKTVHVGIVTSIEAAANLSKNLCVDINGNHSDADVIILGVCAADTDSGEMAPVVISGIVLCITAGAVTAGNIVSSDVGGAVYDLGVNATATVTTEMVGVALDSASASGEYIRVKLY